MRELDIELPPFKKVWYKEEKNAKEFTIIREVQVKMRAYLQEVMPQGIKNSMEAMKSRGGAALPMDREKGGEIRVNKIFFDDSGTSAFKEVPKSEKEKAWEDSMMRRGMQQPRQGSETPEEEEENKPIDHKNFMAFDCHIAHPITKKQMATRMHIDSMATKCIISHQMAQELGLEVMPSEFQRAKLANGEYTPIYGHACFIMHLQGIKAGIEALVIDNPTMAGDFLLGQDWLITQKIRLDAGNNCFEWVTGMECVTGRHRVIV